MSIRQLARQSVAAVLLFTTSAAGQPSDDWHYYGLPAGPSAPGVHVIVGKHHQPVPFYSPYQPVLRTGPRNPIRFGWFGRYTPSPRPQRPNVDVR